MYCVLYAVYTLHVLICSICTVYCMQCILYAVYMLHVLYAVCIVCCICTVCIVSCIYCMSYAVYVLCIACCIYCILYAVCIVCCIYCMQYICCMYCMQYILYAVYIVCCIYCMLYILYAVYVLWVLHVLLDLEYFTLYSMRVQACTAVGCTLSATQTVRTLEAAPSGMGKPVLTPQATLLGAHSGILVVWDVPQNLNGILKEYRVERKDVSDGNNYIIFRPCNLLGHSLLKSAYKCWSIISEKFLEKHGRHIVAAKNLK